MNSIENQNKGEAQESDGSNVESENEQSIPKSAQNLTSPPLKLPDGFSISILAKNLNKPRVMALDPFGNIWVSEMGAGAITSLLIEQGKVTSQRRIFQDLKRPHGLAFDPKNPFRLYVAEEDKIFHFATYSDAGFKKIIDLPGGGRHFSRTIGFGPDDRLYVSIGSSCDVCHEKDERRATIYSMNRDGSDFKLFAKGLRNTVFFTWREDGKMWGTDMGRDFLGDELSPDEINIIEDGKNYGWPICYGKNIHDTAFDKNTYIRNPCSDPFETPSHIDLPAHSAPLGLAFIPPTPNGSGQATDSAWPEEYWGDLLVSYHGSWNRSEPTGYKIVRLKLDDKGNYEGSEDFISGWLDDTRSLGRPVDLLALPNGTLYVTDDKAGVIYKVAQVGT